MSDETVAPAGEVEFVRTGLDLLLESGERIPVASAEIVLEGLARFWVVGGAVHFSSLVVEGHTGQLVDQVEIGGQVIRLVPGGFASLECFSAPSRGQLWSVGPSPVLIGRAGKRVNQVEIAEPSLSRSHATIRDGSVLVCETSSSPTVVNGLPLGLGETRPLVNGDLVRLGNLLFRFHLTGAVGESRLRIFSLGGFEVFRGSARIPDSAWKVQAGRYLLAYLAAEYPRPVALQPLRELFWPEAERDQGRKNLNWALATIKESLGVAEVFVRTSHTVQIRPDLFGWHDLTELRECLPSRVGQALELYRGPYLEGCYLDWALQKRDLLETELASAGLALLRTGVSVVEVGRKVLQLDSCCQEAYLAVMRALREEGRPEEAVRLFETCRRMLAQELEMEPSIELIREHQLAMLNL